MSRRHSRQRSSLSLKKRSSLVQDREAIVHDIHDHALSTDKAVVLKQDDLSLGSPYPGTNAAANQTGRLESNRHNESSDEADWSEKENNPPFDAGPDQSLGGILDGLTTKRNPFGDDIEGGTPSGSSRTAAPRLLPKELGSIPLKRGNSTSASSSYTGPRTPSSASFRSMAASRQNSYSGASSTPTSLAGDRRLSLLTGDSILSSSPSTSPSSVRTMTPSSHRGPKSATRTHPVKRMSLCYVPSPVTKTRFGDLEPTIAVGTPPTSSSSTGGYFGRMQDIPRRPSTGSMMESQQSSASSSSPTLIRSTTREDGDTVMTQHMDILGRIAQKERKILDLKEMLSKEERDLRQLQKEWQESVHRELIASRPETVQVNGSESLAGKTEVEAIYGASANNEIGQAPTTAATEGWKAISARLAGAGTQLNAFIDQLAAPMPEEGRKSGETVRVANAGLGLDVLQEEAEEGEVAKKTAPAPTRKMSNPTATTTNRQAKRTSVFGSSMAVLQKQMEAQFGVTDDKKQETAPSGDAGGWGSWQKRLKEARENASGLLAKAEAKIGQALTLEDLPASTATRKVTRTSVRSPSVANNGGFGLEVNDREKAALAELSWLNSLAGIDMSGTTDRVVTSQSPMSRAAKKTAQDSIEQDDSLTRKLSNSSRRESSQSHASTSRMTSMTSATTITSGPDSPVTSVSGDKGSKDQTFFSMISSGWIPDAYDDKRQSSEAAPATTHKRLPSNGHSKTRLAAEIALQGKQKDMPPAQDNDANDEMAWGLA